MNIGNASIALEFFANVLALSGIISPQTEESICSAKSIEDLDEIIDTLALSVSGDYSL